jgi:hypothetical protein
MTMNGKNKIYNAKVIDMMKVDNLEINSRSKSKLANFFSSAPRSNHFI